MTTNNDTNNESQWFLQQELHNTLRTRYGKLTLATTIGVLEMVKWELINDCPTPPPEEID